MNESRKQFEEWIVRVGHNVSRDARGLYVFSYTATAWVAWQASRASIEIELPENKWHPCDCIDVVIAFDRDDVIESIRAAGIKVKE